MIDCLLYSPTDAAPQFLLKLTPLFIISTATFSLIIPFPPNISMQILHTILNTIPKRLTRRICVTIKSCFSWWSSPPFSWLSCLIQRWYSEEKLDANHSLGIKSYSFPYFRQLRCFNLHSHWSCDISPCSDWQLHYFRLAETCQMSDHFVLSYFVNCDQRQN